MPSTPSTDTREHLSFLVAGEPYAVSLLRVREVAPVPPVTRVPFAPPAVRGVVHRRGAVVPLVDIAARLGRRPAPLTSRAVVVYADALVEGDSAVVGLLVDSIGGVLSLAPSEILPPPSSLAARERALLAGLGCGDAGLVPLLDVDALAVPGSIEVPAAAHGAARAAPARAARDASGSAARESLPRGPAAPEAPGPAPPAPSPSVPLALPPGPPGDGPAASAPLPAAIPVRRRPTGASRTLRTAAHLALTSPIAPSREPGRAEVQGGSTAPPAGRDRVAPPSRRTRLLGLLPGAAIAALLAGLAVWWGGGRGANPEAAPVRTSPAAPRRVAPAVERRIPTEVAPSAGRAPTGSPVAPPPEEAVHSAASSRETAHGPSVSGATASGETICEVAAGDTLWALSRRHYGNAFLWGRIFRANRERIADPDLITPGERLRIPPRP